MYLPKKHFDLKQTNKAYVSFPIKIFPSKISGTGFGSLAVVTEPPANAMQKPEEERRQGPSTPSQGFGHGSVCAWGREGILGAPGQAEGKAPVAPRQPSSSGLGASGWAPLQPGGLVHSHWVCQKDHPQAVCFP